MRTQSICGNRFLFAECDSCRKNYVEHMEQVGGSQLGANRLVIDCL